MKRVTIILEVIIMVALTGCGESKEKTIIGKWKEVDGTQIMEFFKDGTVRVVDKGEPPLTGDYKFIDGSRIRMEFKGIGELLGPIVAEISRSGNEITLTAPDGKIEKYRRWEKSTQEGRQETSARYKENNRIFTAVPKTKSKPSETLTTLGAGTSTLKVTFSRGVFRVGDFSIGFASIKREPQNTNLDFVVTKVKNTGSRIGPLALTLIDDHQNSYHGKLDATPYDDFPSHLLPEDFTYIQTVSIKLPKAAPIETIQLEGAEAISFKKLKLVKPEFKSDFGVALLKQGEPAQVGKFLSFAIDGIVPDLYTWALAATIENKDYNQLRVGIQCAVQFADGTIGPPETPVMRAVGGLSKDTTRLKLESLRGRETLDPRMLLVVYRDFSSDQAVLKLWPISDKDLRPRVGQGQGMNESIFIEAYKRNGGREVMGDPLGLPHWYAGGTRPKDEQDLLIQEFPENGKIGKSAIVWGEQDHASKAHVLHGPILKKYLETGGPYGRSNVQQDLFLGAPTSNIESCQSGFGSKGSFAAFKGGVIFQQADQTFVLMGKIGKKWDEKENELGFPASEAKKAASGAKGVGTSGWAQEFEGGYIYCITNDKHVDQVFELHGKLSETYREIGGESGWLGFPTSECYASPETGYQQCDFEAGYIATSDGNILQPFPYEPGMIAFVSDRDGNKEIYVMNASGTYETNLTKHPANDWAPVWSPDGTKILFVSDRQPLGIYLMNADGTAQKFLAAGEDPSWFPDGQRIIFSKPLSFERKIGWSTEKELLKRIFTVRVDGTGVQELSPDPATANVRDFNFIMRKNFVEAVVSQDGSKIAFARGRSSGHPATVYLMDTDGKNLRGLVESLTKQWQSGEDPSWSPDGTKIAFIDDMGYGGPVGNAGRLYIADLETSLISGPHLKIIWCCGGLDWSPDGSAIVFSGYKETGYTYEGTVDIYIVRPGLKVLRKITEGQGNNYAPSWTGVGR